MGAKKLELLFQHVDRDGDAVRLRRFGEAAFTVETALGHEGTGVFVVVPKENAAALARALDPDTYAKLEAALLANAANVKEVARLTEELRETKERARAEGHREGRAAERERISKAVADLRAAGRSLALADVDRLIAAPSPEVAEPEPADPAAFLRLFIDASTSPWRPKSEEVAHARACLAVLLAAAAPLPGPAPKLWPPGGSGYENEDYPDAPECRRPVDVPGGPIPCARPAGHDGGCAVQPLDDDPDPIIPGKTRREVLRAAAPHGGPGEPVTIDHAIAIASAALTFGQVKRATLHPDGSEESDATHTVMLAMVAAELARAEGLDVGLAVQFAVVHDLPETYAGDTNTARALSPEAATAKAAREAASLARLTVELGPCWSTSMVERYEAQREPEARLVRYADKIMPKLTHILNGGEALAAIGMTAAEVEEKHAEQGAALWALYPELGRTRALFRDACERALDVMRARRPAPPSQGAEPGAWQALCRSLETRAEKAEASLHDVVRDAHYALDDAGAGLDHTKPLPKRIATLKTAAAPQGEAGPEGGSHG